MQLTLHFVASTSKRGVRSATGARGDCDWAERVQAESGSYLSGRTITLGRHIQETISENPTLTQGPRSLTRQDGVTRAERYLQRLCERSFLRLWSYPGVFRDQGLGKSKEGKEICDLLVVFDNHVIIFSDKACLFPDTGDIAIDWQRWFRRAVLKAAMQVESDIHGPRLFNSFSGSIARCKDRQSPSNSSGAWRITAVPRNSWR